MSEALREKNLDTIKRFFQLKGLDRLEAFTEDGAKELGYGVDPEAPAPRWNGKEMLKENFGGNLTMFSAWTWENMSFYSTQDPNRFFVEADGHSAYCFSKAIQYRRGREKAITIKATHGEKQGFK